MKDLSIYIGFCDSSTKTKTFTLKDIFGDKKIDKKTKLRLELHVGEGTMGASFSTAKIEVA